MVLSCFTEVQTNNSFPKVVLELEDQFRTDSLLIETTSFRRSAAEGNDWFLMKILCVGDAAGYLFRYLGDVVRHD